MNDLMLKGAVAADTARRRMTERVADVVANRNERGDIVQTIIIIAMFVLICVVVGGILYNAITTQAGQVEDCITNANSGSCDDFQRR